VGNELIIWKNINIGIAMELEDGLIVPVVKDVDRKSIYEIQKGLEDLYERVRKNRILPDDIQGGTFTITNLGSLDVDVFTPIINQPENAILGVGRIVDRPGFSEEGSIIKRKKMPLSLTCDHRAIDGARGARFLKMVKEYIEAPYLLIE
jgi:pyruvate dehydrogenase E2 component (dihydrolipoamide acetyltransferase)